MRGPKGPQREFSVYQRTRPYQEDLHDNARRSAINHIHNPNPNQGEKQMENPRSDDRLIVLIITKSSVEIGIMAEVVGDSTI